ncbi:hypothetical protein TNCT_416651 [Trichonephila clavata]|uniref:Uncharacterized protein n=1 Tax=Trichonephila clavata TaxID=2740835 RepID=A0A8X6GNK4_TRICU|nr:hypothetical protein TNCT_416651 [Trichonephila clavata]
MRATRIKNSKYYLYILSFSLMLPILAIVLNYSFIGDCPPRAILWRTCVHFALVLLTGILGFLLLICRLITIFIRHFLPIRREQELKKLTIVLFTLLILFFIAAPDQRLIFLLPTDCSIPGVNLDSPDTHHTTRTEIPSHTLTVTSTTDSLGTRGPPNKELNFLLDYIASATAPHLTDSPRSCPRDTGEMESPSTPGTSTQMDTDEDAPTKYGSAKN